ncbi:corticotropin-releasing factor-binding protein [Aplysia californica]|uniref:Corticotropin-releasing factor-binding protein n=1 Tax=Aplysia californica TaxID=6500 RepID=A0ABM1A7M7_APLCA|nr:corticotropin-releasing factor-binding protein [Aplysia californica]
MFTRLRDVIIICAFVSQTLLPSNAFTSPANPIWMERRSAGMSEAGAEETEGESPVIECGWELRSLAGSYTYVSEGEDSLCTLYLLAPIDHVIQLEFPFFNVACAEDSAVDILDGWKLDGQVFPSSDDHPQPMSYRELRFCGEGARPGPVTSKQNIVQIFFKVPVRGQGFMVKVAFKVNKKPCSMMLWRDNYERVTLDNFGLRSNCTVMSLYPQRVQFLYVNVGEQEKDIWYSNSPLGKKRGLRTTCESEMGEDSVKVYQGHGVGPSWRRMVLGFCGVRTHKVPKPVPLRCHSSAVTLKSSGQFYNKLIFSFLPDQDGVILC